MNLVARKSITPILTTSVPVVRKMLDAAAGSAPHLLRNTGTNAPINPLTIQLATMETKIIMARARACGLLCWVASAYITTAQMAPVTKP